MKNQKIIDEKNLLLNLEKFDDKKICAMVKANAYGHGLKEIVKILQDRVLLFGVAKAEEGIEIKKFSDQRVLVCGRADYKLCQRHGLEVMIESESDIAECARLKGLSMHLKIDCGMNRFGVKSALNMGLIDKLLLEHDIKLQSVYTHFPCTEKRHKTFLSYKKFLEISSKLTQKPQISFGGSEILNYPFDYDILRVGIGLYGYGNEFLKPVMKIVSYVCKVFYAKKGESIGYSSGYKVKQDGRFAIIQIGYADGLARALSGKIFFEIRGKLYRSVGKICMDVCFALVDEAVTVGDEVIVMSDASAFAKVLKTAPHEILTNFSSFRGQTIVKRAFL